MTISVVSFLFFWCSTGALWSTLLGAGFLYCILSASSLDPNSSGPKWPLRLGVAFPTTSRLQLSAIQLALFNSSALYYLQTPTRRYGHASTPPQFLPISGDRDVSLPLSLEWPVWSSSSGSNCYAVYRSLCSGASVYECTMGIFF